MKTVLALALLFIAESAAKLSFGACPSINAMTYSQYSGLLASPHYYYHLIAYSDKDFKSYLDLTKDFLKFSQFFDYIFKQCAELYGSSQYYSTESLFNSHFPGHSRDDIVYELVGYEPTTDTEVLYRCTDTTKLPGLLRTMKDLGE